MTSLSVASLTSPKSLNSTSLTAPFTAGILGRLHDPEQYGLHADDVTSRYRSITPKARLIPLTQPFVDYLRADGILLPDEDDPEIDTYHWSDDSGNFSADSSENGNDDAAVAEDIAKDWREDVHNRIKSTIAELGGNVVPKLNWSAPKDALQMNANTMECIKADEIYTLLKSSAFVTHDLENAFDDCVDDETSISAPLTVAQIPYHLVLRKTVNFNPSVEFRCFVRRGKLLAVCQRDPNYYEFLHKSRDHYRRVVQDFFDLRLCGTFPDESYVFDCYIPGSQNKAWLIDINPWAQRTDPLLFSWLELLEAKDPPEQDDDDDVELDEGFARLYFQKGPDGTPIGDAAREMESKAVRSPPEAEDDAHDNYDQQESDEESADEELWLPEFRLVGLNDPVHRMNAQSYSAHKLPKDVVDASQGVGGMREALALNDLQALKRAQKEQEEDESDDADD
nr:cell division cycle protein 123 [Quercus suber]